jgi:hypothetical protein
MMHTFVFLVNTTGRKMDVETIVNVVIRFRNEKEYVFMSCFGRSLAYGELSRTLAIIIIQSREVVHSTAYTANDDIGSQGTVVAEIVW